MKKVLETERLFLREMTMSDLDALYAVLGDPEIMQHYPYSFDEERVRGWIERNMNRYENDGFGLWAVCLKETGEMIGDCGLTLQNIDGTMLPEIGYHIRKDQQHRGYAKEAAAAVRDWAFSNTEYPALYSYCKYTNVGSFKTAESIGMHFEKEYPDEANKITRVSVIRREDMEEIKLPEGIKKRIEGKTYTMDDMGKSGSKVLIFDDAVLKIVKFRQRNEEVIKMLRWLEGKVPAPRDAVVGQALPAPVQVGRIARGLRRVRPGIRRAERHGCGHSAAGAGGGSAFAGVQARDGQRQAHAPRLGGRRLVHARFRGDHRQAQSAAFIQARVRQKHIEARQTALRREDDALRHAARGRRDEAQRGILQRERQRHTAEIGRAHV